jgi:hypothetical protein
MSLARKFGVLVLAVALAPVVSQAASPRGLTYWEIAIQKVSEAMVKNDLKFVTAPTDNICGTTGTEGTDVKVQLEVRGRYVTIRHYGVTYAGFFSREKAIECAD